VSDLPLSNYRIQFTKDFGFDAAAALVPYLKDLGITHLYASPFLKARPRSTHGYDIVDHNALNPELGGEDAFIRMSDALQGAGLGLILDFVPNHMGIGLSDNAWWLDVLEWGQRSPHAASFDISWDLLPYRHGGGVLLPVLGKPYGDALQAGEIKLKFDPATGAFAAWYFEHKFPINPQRYGEMLRHIVTAADAAQTTAGRALLAIASEHAHPQSPSYRDAPVLKDGIRQIDGVSGLIERGLSAYDPATDSGRHALHRLLERQHYRLAFWRVAISGINYRRFFDVNDLAGVRVEHAQTFRGVHQLIARLIKEDRLQGLRIDHIDGLRDPFQYTRKLRQLVKQIRGRTDRRPFPIYVEKILGEGEPMPKFPGVIGTTGYEWMNLFSRVLLDGRGLGRLEETWRNFSGQRRSFGRLFEDSKSTVLETLLASEFTVLTQLLARIAAGHYSTRDHTPDRLSAALRLYVLAFPVYRTYISGSGPSPEDREMIARTIAAARSRWSGPDADIFDFLQAVITLDLIRDTRAYSAPRIREFALKLQQFTGPLMAKSLEDTCFYRYFRLLALNEVGGDPVSNGCSVAEFHDQAQKFSPGLVATATHDTKRGEDARMRILALSELSDDWASSVEKWRTMNARFRGAGPSSNHEYMIYQVLVGSWPFGPIDQTFVDRIKQFALKAAREGKAETSWISPNVGYENALDQFISAILDHEQNQDFIAAVSEVARRTSFLGMLNSLSQLTLKSTLPGTPDFYQGTELWDLSLVDPDNRRPVDFAERQALLWDESDWTALKAQWPSGRIKFALTRRLLELRKRLPALFTKGDYRPVAVSGAHAAHVIAFARTHHRKSIIVAASRHLAGLTGDGLQWPQPIQAEIDVSGVPGRRFRELLTDTTFDPASQPSLFGTLPVAILESM
jgi:(1->4)-alpha-D-glucan 1-alpha-D-glucosylmutase